jgi:hypothetical protein
VEVGGASSSWILINPTTPRSLPKRAGARRSHNYVLDTKFKNAFALSKTTLVCRSTLLVWPHKVTLKVNNSCAMLKAVAQLQMARGGPDVKCHLLGGGSVSMQSLRRWRVSRLVRATVVILQTCLLVACSTSLQKKLGAADSALDATTTAVRNADFSARSPIAADEARDSQAPRSSKPLLFQGAEPDSAPQRLRDSDYGVGTASSEPVTVRGDDVEINFEGGSVSVGAGEH